MSAEISGPWCSHCRTPLSPDHAGSCPACGKTGKTWGVATGGTITPTGTLDRTREHREVVQKRRAMKWALRAFEVMVLVVGFWIGEWWSFALGVALFVLGEVYGSRTIERIERDHWHDPRP